MRVGDQVTHDFSGGLGVVVQIDRTSNYPYKVEWPDGKADWYKPSALRVLKKTRHSSTER